MMHWLADNWLPLAVILCLVCMVIDTVVHILRWQPYKVWASFFRRISGRQEEEDYTGHPVRHRAKRMVHRQWIYADGTARTEAVEQETVPPEEEAHPWQDVTPALQDYELDQEAYRRQFARPESQNVQAVTPGLEDYPQPAPIQDVPQTTGAEEPVTVSRRSRRLSRESTRAAFQQLFASHDEEELDLSYKPAQPAVDKEDAYNKPYYPPQWKPPTDVGTGSREA